MIKIFSFFSVLLFFISVNAQEETQNNDDIITDRPDQTESPTAVGKNKFQIETGFLYEQPGEDFVSLSTPGILFRYGLSNGTELRLEGEYSQIKYRQVDLAKGFQPFSVGFKKELISEQKGWIPQTGFLLHVAIPGLAAEEFDIFSFAPSFRFLMNNELSEVVSIGYNLGVEWNGDDNIARGLYTFTTAFSFLERWGVYAEIFGFLPHRYPHFDEHSINGGFTFSPQNNMQVDILAGFGLNENASDFFLGGGFSIRLPN